MHEHKRDEHEDASRTPQDRNRKQCLAPQRDERGDVDEQRRLPDQLVERGVEHEGVDAECIEERGAIHPLVASQFPDAGHGVNDDDLKAAQHQRDVVQGTANVCGDESTTCALRRTALRQPCVHGEVGAEVREHEEKQRDPVQGIPAVENVEVVRLKRHDEDQRQYRHDPGLEPDHEKEHNQDHCKKGDVEEQVVVLRQDRVPEEVASAACLWIDPERSGSPKHRALRDAWQEGEQQPGAIDDAQYGEAAQVVFCRCKPDDPALEPFIQLHELPPRTRAQHRHSRAMRDSPRRSPGRWRGSTDAIRTSWCWRRTGLLHRSDG